MRIFEFSQNETGKKERVHGNDVEGVILFLLWCTFLVPSLKITAQYFWRYPWFSILSFKWKYLWHHHFLHLHNTKAWISLKLKKIFQKGRHHSSLLSNAFQISSNYFLINTALWGTVYFFLAQSCLKGLHYMYLYMSFLCCKQKRQDHFVWSKVMYKTERNTWACCKYVNFTPLVKRLTSNSVCWVLVRHARLWQIESYERHLCCSSSFFLC